MIEIDGSHQEGGGQIVRTAVGLSSYSGGAVRIVNIRKGRPNPGLQAQHIAAIRAVRDLCNAKVSGDTIGSEMVEFRPSRELRSEVHVTIPTAGSCGLVLQAVFIACMGFGKRVRIEIDGGATWGKWAPPVAYLQNVFLLAARRFGLSAKIDVVREGFYPKGGARVMCEIEPRNVSRIKQVKLTDISMRPRIRGISVAAHELVGRKVAERQARIAEKMIVDPGDFEFLGIEARYEDTACAGSGILLWTEDDVFLGGSSIGEKGKTAEEVGREAADMIVAEHDRKGCVDRYLADQIIPILGIRGGEIRTSEITPHTETNIWTFEQFFGRKFDINRSENIITCKGILRDLRRRDRTHK